MKPILVFVLLGPAALLVSGCFHVTGASDERRDQHDQPLALPPPPPVPISADLPSHDLASVAFPANLQQDCQGGQQTSCVGLAVLYWEGAGVAQERSKARGMLEQACQAGEESGCRILAGLTGQRSLSGSTTTEVTLDPETEAKRQVILGSTDGPNSAAATQAAGLMKQLCDQGNMEGCAGLGSLYWKGLGVPKDKETSRRLLKRACDGGDANGCTLLQIFAKESP